MIIEQDNNENSDFLSFLDLTLNIQEIYEERQNILKKHFPKYFTVTVKNSEPKEYHYVLDKPVTHPNIFLASSLCFNRNNFNKIIEPILEHFGLKDKLKYPCMENYYKYEKLKLMLIKYVENMLKRRKSR